MEDEFKDDISDLLLPNKSKVRYKKAWKEFYQFIKMEDMMGLYKPSLLDFQNYFIGQKEKGISPSTLWSTFSKLNACYQASFGSKLQSDMPSLILLLKRFNEGYQRKVAAAFSAEEIWLFLSKSHEGPTAYWLLRKAYTALMFCGGIRTEDAKNLTFGDIELIPEGYKVSHTPCKQRGEVVNKQFIVPLNTINPSACFGSHLKCYMDYAQVCLGDKLTKNTRLFLTCMKNGRLSSVPMGKNYLYAIPKDVAKSIGLDQTPYTGHSFKCTSATAMANAGASSLEMRTHFNWKDDATANKYIRESNRALSTIGSYFNQSVNTASGTVEYREPTSTLDESYYGGIANCFTSPNYEGQEIIGLENTMVLPEAPSSLTNEGNCLILPEGNQQIMDQTDQDPLNQDCGILTQAMMSAEIITPKVRRNVTSTVVSTNITHNKAETKKDSRPITINFNAPISGNLSLNFD